MATGDEPQIGGHGVDNSPSLGGSKRPLLSWDALRWPWGEPRDYRIALHGRLTEELSALAIGDVIRFRVHSRMQEDAEVHVYMQLLDFRAGYHDEREMVYISLTARAFMLSGPTDDDRLPPFVDLSSWRPEVQTYEPRWDIV